MYLYTWHAATWAAASSAASPMAATGGREKQNHLALVPATLAAQRLRPGVRPAAIHQHPNCHYYSHQYHYIDLWSGAEAAIRRVTPYAVYLLHWHGVWLVHVLLSVFSCFRDCGDGLWEAIALGKREIQCDGSRSHVYKQTRRCRQADK